MSRSHPGSAPGVQKDEQGQLWPNSRLSTCIELIGDFEVDRDSVVAAMLFPHDLRLRLAYLLRKEMERGADADADKTLTPHQQRVVLDWPSRAELRDLADGGARRGHAVGDLVAIMYDRHRRGLPDGLRSALGVYKHWALGKHYGEDKLKPLKRSESQLRSYFHAARPAAHLWGAFRLIASIEDRPLRPAFENPEDFGYFLGVSAEIQRFLSTHVPAQNYGGEPTIPLKEMLLLPEPIRPIAVPGQPAPK